MSRFLHKTASKKIKTKSTKSKERYEITTNFSFLNYINEINSKFLNHKKYSHSFTYELYLICRYKGSLIGNRYDIYSRS